MLVTDKNYSIDKKLLHYLDMICNERISKESKDDALMIVEGDTGTGKSTMAAHIAYYIAWKTHRPFSQDNFFFNIEEMMEFAISTEEQIIIWDEPALGGLTNQWYNKAQIKLKQMLMMCRKKRHMFIFCFTHFHKFSDYFVVDRSIGMIKTYKEDRLKIGNYMYFGTEEKERLYNDWKKRREKNYWKLKLFNAEHYEQLSFYIDEDTYEKRKDQAILSLGEKENFDRREFQFKKLQYLITTLDCGLSLDQKLKHFQITNTAYYEWSRLLENYPNLMELGTSPNKRKQPSPQIVYKGLEGTKKKEDIEDKKEEKNEENKI